MKTTFLVNGYEVNAEYQESEINEIFLPLLMCFVYLLIFL